MCKRQMMSLSYALFYARFSLCFSLECKMFTIFSKYIYFCFVFWGLFYSMLLKSLILLKSKKNIYILTFFCPHCRKLKTKENRLSKGGNLNLINTKK